MSVHINGLNRIKNAGQTMQRMTDMQRLIADAARAMVIAAVLALAASSCLRQGEELRRLTAIEPLLEHNPDSARVLLDGIDPAGFRGESLALYALLKTQADYKCYVDIPSDSLIRKATAYYGTRRKGYHAAMSWYSLGCVNDLLQNDTSAIDAYLSSLQLFPDTLTKSFVYCKFKLGLDYLYHGMDNEARYILASCHNDAVRLQDSTLCVYCDYHQALLFLYDEEYYKSDSILTAVMEEGYLPSSLSSAIYREKSKIHFHGYNQYDSAMYYVNLSIDCDADATNSGTSYSLKADIFNAIGIKDSAYLYYIWSLESDFNTAARCKTYRNLSLLASELNLNEESLYYLEKYSKTLERYYEESQQEVITKMQTKQNEDIHRLQIRAVRKRTAWLMILLTVIIVTIIAKLYNRKVKRIKNAYAAEYAERLQAFKKEKNKELERLAHEGRNRFVDCEAYLMMRDIVSSRREATLIERNLIEQNIFQAFSSLYEEIRSKAPQMNHEEMFYFFLSLSGLKSAQCEYIMFDHSNLRMTKNRIKSKMPDEIGNLLQ